MKVKRLILKRADSTELQRLQSILPTPVLAKEGYFILDTDASDFAVGGELRQVQDMCVLTIRYANSVPSAEQSRYCTTRKELIAVVRFTRQFRHFLLGWKFTVRTDLHCLT